jgi:hypothetical protein
METFVESLNKIPDIRERTAEFFKHIKYVKTFKSSGLQSKAGIMSFENIPFVYKVCKYGISNSVQHEYNVTKDLEEINLPTFQRCYGMCILHVGRDIIDIMKKRNKKVLFLHLYERFPLCQFLDFSHTDKMRVASFVLNILMTIYVLHEKKKFCQHDLHAGNILLQKCDEGKVMCYDFTSIGSSSASSSSLASRTSGEKYLIPTYGYYPVIIDFGNSYSSGIEGKGMQTHTDKYYKGFRYAIPDDVEDIHHFLLTAFSYLKDVDVNDNSEEFKKLGLRIWLQFRGMSLTPSGWKRLKVNVTDELLNNVYHLKGKKKKKYGIIEKYHARFFEVFNPLIILPFKKNGKSLRESFHLLNGFISALQLIESQTFNKVNDIKGRWYLEQICWFIEKKISEENKMTEEKKDTFLEELRSETGLDIVFPPDFIYQANVYSENLSNIYSLLTEIDTKTINNWYSGIKIKNAKDMFLFFAKNIITPSFKITPDSLIEIYSFENNTIKEIKLDNKEKIRRINDAAFLNKGRYL